MDVKTQVDALIDMQESAIRWHLLTSLIIGLLGIAIIITVNLYSLGPETLKTLLSIGGGFVSSLVTLPIKEMISHRVKLKVFLILKNEIITSPESNERISALFWETIKKIVEK